MNHDKYYLDLAKEASVHSTCLKGNFGVVIVKNDMVLGIGYNGPARGVKHCNPCRREGYAPGEGYHLCIAVHAEVNALITAGGRDKCIGADLYIASHNRPWNKDAKYHAHLGDFPCNNCARLIVNAGIRNVVHYEKDDAIVRYNVPDLVAEGMIE